MTRYEVLYFVFRNKWLLLAGAVGGLAAAGAVYKFTPRTYRSDAKLLVKYVTETMIDESDTAGRSVLRPGQPSANVIGTEVDILTSEEIAVAASEALAAAGTNNPSGPFRVSVREMMKRLKVSSSGGSNTIELSFEGASPALAQRVLDEVLSAYFRKHQEVHRDPNAIQFLADRADEIRKRLAEAEEAVRRVKDEAGIASLSDARSLLTMRIQDLDRATRERESSLIATRARLGVIRQQIARATPAAPAPGTNGTAAVEATFTRDDALRQLAELERREAQLLGTYTPDSLPVRTLRKQMEELRRLIGQRTPAAGVTNQLRPVVVGRPMQESLLADEAAYQAEEAALVAQLEGLHRQVEAARGEAKRLDAWESQIVGLERTREMYDEQYRHFSQRLESARIDSAVGASKIASIPIVQPPTLPDRPVTEGLKKMLGLILVAGFGGGMALGYLREFVLDQSMRHPGEVAGLLQMPLLAVLPWLRRGVPASRSAAARERGRERRKVNAFDSACEVITQMLRGQMVRRKPPLLVGFASPHEGAGVTTLAGRVAENMRLSGIRTVLLASVSHDGQFTAKMLGSLTAGGEATEVPESPAGSVETASRAPERREHPVAVSFSKPMPISPVMLDDFSRQDYDCVLFDLPPMNEADVTMRLLPRLHGIVLVLATLKTRRGQAEDCARQFDQLQCLVYGAVLNRFRTFVPAWLSPSPTTPASTAGGAMGASRTSTAGNSPDAS